MAWFEEVCWGLSLSPWGPVPVRMWSIWLVHSPCVMKQVFCALILLLQVSPQSSFLFVPCYPKVLEIILTWCGRRGVFTREITSFPTSVILCSCLLYMISRLLAVVSLSCVYAFERSGDMGEAAQCFTHCVILHMHMGTMQVHHVGGRERVSDWGSSHISRFSSLGCRNLLHLPWWSLSHQRILNPWLHYSFLRLLLGSLFRLFISLNFSFMSWIVS